MGRQSASNKLSYLRAVVTVTLWNWRALWTEQVASSIPGSVGYIIIISPVHRAYDYSGPFGVLWVHIA